MAFATYPFNQMPYVRSVFFKKKSKVSKLLFQVDSLSCMYRKMEKSVFHTLNLNMKVDHHQTLILTVKMKAKIQSVRCNNYYEAWLSAWLLYVLWLVGLFVSSWLYLVYHWPCVHYFLKAVTSKYAISFLGRYVNY